MSSTELQSSVGKGGQSAHLLKAGTERHSQGGDMLDERNSVDLSHLNESRSTGHVAAQHCASCLEPLDADAYCTACDVVTVGVALYGTPATVHFVCDGMPPSERRMLAQRARALMPTTPRQRPLASAGALTERQREVLAFLVSYTRDAGYPPTLREIAKRLGIRSTNGVNDHLRALERKGFIRRDEMAARGIVVLRTEEVGS